MFLISLEPPPHLWSNGHTKNAAKAIKLWGQILGNERNIGGIANYVSILVPKSIFHNKGIVWIWTHEKVVSDELRKILHRSTNPSVTGHPMKSLGIILVKPKSGKEL